MSTIGQVERKTQLRVVKLFRETLKYRDRLRELVPPLLTKTITSCS